MHANAAAPDRAHRLTYVLYDNLATPFNCVMLALALLLLALDAHADLWFFFPVLLNAGLRTGYDLSAQHAIRSVCSRGGQRTEPLSMRRRPTELKAGLSHMLVVLMLVAVPLAAWKGFALVRHGSAPREAVIYAAGMIASLVPAAMVLLISASLLICARELRKRRVVAASLYSVELLAHCDAVCFSSDALDAFAESKTLSRLREQGLALYFFHSTEADASDPFICDARTLRTPDEYSAAVQAFSVFSHAGGAERAALVQELQAAGHTVAMVGSLDIDAAALHRADCAVCPYTGARSAVLQAQLVLLSDTVNALPAAVLEGRRAINNATRTGELFVKKSFCSFVLYLLALIVRLPYPMTQLHWSFTGAFTVIIPAIVLAFERQYQPIHGRFVSNVFYEAAPGALLHVAYLLLAVLLSRVLGLTSEMRLTFCVLAASAAGLAVLWHVCRPLDRLRAVLCTLMTLLLPAALVLFRGRLGLVDLPPAGAYAVSLLGMLAYPLQHVSVRIVERVGRAVRCRGKKRRLAVPGLLERDEGC